MEKTTSFLESTIREAREAYVFEFFSCEDGSTYELFAHDVSVTLIEKPGEVFWISQIVSLDAEPEAQFLISKILSKHLLLLEFRTNLFLSGNDLKIMMVSCSKMLETKSFVEFLEDFIFCTLEVKSFW